MFRDYRHLLYVIKRSVVVYLIVNAIPCWALRGYELKLTGRWNAVHGVGVGWGFVNVLVQMYVISRWAFFIQLGMSHSNVVFENRDLQPISV